MKFGSLVLPKINNENFSDTIYLTPQEEDDAENIEKWIEWRIEQFGIVINICKDLQTTILTPNGIGICFRDELVVIDDCND